MSHSFTKIWIHAIFSTKDRVPLLKDHFSDQIYAHINGRFSDLGCDARIINGTEDHLHILFLLSPDKTIAQVIKAIKGESSHWINQQDFLNAKFAWQVGYSAFSVSESNVKSVENYLRRQEEHHRRMTFQEEYERFISRYGLSGNR